VYNIGSTGSDAGNSLDLDNSGNIYLTGYFIGQDVDFSPASGTSGDNALSEVGGGASPSGDVFVVKYSPAMVYQWGFGYGSGLFDEGVSIIVSKSTSNVFVSGNVENDALSIDFDPSGAIANFSGYGGDDLFLASYTSAGAYRWHKGIGSTLNDDANNIAFDNSGNILMTGSFQGSNIDFGNGQILSSSGNKDVFLAQFSANGTTLNAFNVGGSSSEQGNTVAYTNSGGGRVFLAGILTGAGDYDPTAAVSTLTPNGTQDGFVARYQLCTAPSITTHPVAQAVCSGTSLTLSVTASSATSYQWKKGGVAIPLATSATYTKNPAAAGDAATYTVDVINSCNTVTSNAAVITVSTCTGISSGNEKEAVVRIYPKPSSSSTTIEFKGRKGQEAMVTILSMSGSIVWKGSINLNSDIDQYILPTNELGAGLYVIQIQIGNELFTDKLERNP